MPGSQNTLTALTHTPGESDPKLGAPAVPDRDLLRVDRKLRFRFPLKLPAVAQLA